jgi:hypothetical protein
MTFQAFPIPTGFLKDLFSLSKWLTSINALLIMDEPTIHTLRHAILIYSKI